MTKNKTLKLIENAVLDPALFLLAVVVGHCLWHLLFPSTTLESANVLLFDRFDITHIAYRFQSMLSNHVYHCAQWFNHDVLRNDLTIFIPEHSGSYIAWGCTGVKQAIIFCIAILTARGKHIHKLWFIPCGIIVLYFVNVIRVVIVFFVGAFHYEYFTLMHDQVLKIGYYVIIFFIWWIWQKAFNPKYNLNVLISQQDK
ncbi:MAG: exosortase/archaeosortase family protein [Bacteroidales bacterium]|nr:exosortase/archaeosortase family protein [Bacteroidales bacterium]